MYICRKRFLKKDLVNSLEKKAYARSHTQPSVCGFEFRYIYYFLSAVFVFLHYVQNVQIQRKYRPEKTPYLIIFHAA